jgi:hypothetical protein
MASPHEIEVSSSKFPEDEQLDHGWPTHRAGRGLLPSLPGFKSDARRSLDGCWQRLSRDRSAFRGSSRSRGRGSRRGEAAQHCGRRGLVGEVVRCVERTGRAAAAASPRRHDGGHRCTRSTCIPDAATIVRVRARIFPGLMAPPNNGAHPGTCNARPRALRTPKVAWR